MKINSIELEIGEQKITLTLKQVAELKRMLNQAFPDPQQIPIYLPGPEKIVEKPVYPHLPYDTGTPYWRLGEVICKSSDIKISAKSDFNS